jgi:hypothetical protein
MVIAESYAFNLLLADYIAFGSTPFQQHLAAWGLCVMFSAVFVILAELAGRSQYYQHQAHVAFKLHQGASALAQDLRPSGHEIHLDTNDDDKDLPSSIRMLNRSQRIVERTTMGQEVKPYSVALILVSSLVLIVMVGIYGFRVYDLNRKETQEVRLKQELIQEEKAPVKSSSTIPDDLRETQARAEERAGAEEEGGKRSAFYWAFAIFSALFVGVQAVGILIAYSFGFASDHGERAFQATKDFDSAGAYEEFHERLRRDLDGFAQQTLSALQQLVAVEGDKVNLKNSWRSAIQTSSERTFPAYLQQREQVVTQQAIMATPPKLPKDNRVFYTISNPDGTISQGMMGLEELKTKVLRTRVDADKVKITFDDTGDSLSFHEYLTREA